MAKEMVIHLPKSNLKIAVKCFGDSNARPVLALHGWLDNAASFDVLAPLLQNIYLIVPDLPGHGLSEHNAQGHAYFFMDYVKFVKEFSEVLGLVEFGILGHSLGAVIASIYAGTFPQTLSHLVFLDGVGPFSLPAHAAPEKLADSIKKILAAPVKPPAMYASFEEACRMRQSGTDLSWNAVVTLAKRGVAKNNEGYFWKFDRKLMWPSLMFMTEEQVQSFLQNISVNVCVLAATYSIMPPQALEKRLEYLQEKTLHIIEGHHHFHLDNPAPVAEILNDYFQL